MFELPAGKRPEREKSLTEQVQETLEGLLQSGQLPPDTRMSIRDLAAQLGVSTMPVRGAVSRLVAQGALVTERNRAVLVPRLSVEDFRDLTDVRILTECHTLRLALPNISPDTLAELHRLNDAFSLAMTDPTATDAVLLNQKLHFTIYAAAQSPTLMQIISTNWLRAGPMISLDIGLPSRRLRNAHSVRAHGDMLDAIATRDPEAATAALTSDIRTTANHIIRDAMTPASDTAQPTR